ncbi:hypothetical protein B0H12DRAFT_1118359 [Mycena haematopus]|nr:hypothetical protein B0H12DRAFT_1118359 [Mycena haematopus]
MQAELQAIVLFKLDHDSQWPATRQSKVCLVAAVGPIYVTAVITREQIESAHPMATATLEQVNEELDQLEMQEAFDRGQNDVAVSPDDMRDDFNTFVREEYTALNSLLRECWSLPRLLDSIASDNFLGKFRGLPIFDV